MTTTVVSISEKKEIKESNRKKIEKLVAGLWIIALRMGFMAMAFYYFIKIAFVPYAFEFLISAILAISFCKISIRDWVKSVL